MAVPIQVKRGSGPPPTLLAGEPAFDTTNHKLYVGDGSANTLINAGGTVTTVSVVSANGFAGTVATATTTPAITLTTTVTGLLKGNGTSVSAAVADTDYATPAGVVSYVGGYAQPLDATLTALAGLNPAGSHNLIVSSGADSFVLLSLAANTFPARSSTGNVAAKAVTDFALTLLDDADAATARATLGVGSGTVTSVSGTTNQVAVATGTTTPVVSLAGPHNFTTLTNHGVLLGAGTSAVTATAVMTDGQLLVGQTAADSLPKTLSGDATLAATGALTVANDAVTYAKMQNVSAASKLLGRGDSGSGDPQEITLGSGLSMAGTTLSASGTSYTDEQAQDAVGGILTDSATIDFTYDDAGNTIKADVKDNVIVLTDSKASGTAGGTFTSGAWRTRDLQTEQHDGPGACTLPGSNQFTLLAGTYEVDARAPAFYVNSHQAILYNVTDAGTTLTGTSEYSGVGTAYSVTPSVIRGVFTIAATKTFEIRHQCTSTNTTFGFGQPAGFTAETYTVVTLRKLA